KLLGIQSLAVETGDDCETCETSVVSRRGRRVAIQHLQPPCISWCEPNDTAGTATRPEARDDRRLFEDVRSAVCRAAATLLLLLPHAHEDVIGDRGPRAGDANEEKEQRRR